MELDAIKEAWKVFANSLVRESSEKVEFIRFGVSNDLPTIPLSVTDLMNGTMNRVENLILQLKREKTEADYYVGLEMGFNVVDSHGPRRMAFLESWAYVSDGHRGSYGHSGGITVPPRIADPVIDRGIDLSIVLDRFASELEIESDQGSWGMLTRDILSARHAYVVALISAFAPFYNPTAFGHPISV